MHEQLPGGTDPLARIHWPAQEDIVVEDQELIAEYSKAGVFFDSALMKSSNIAKDITDYAERERSFYVKTGRIK